MLEPLVAVLLLANGEHAATLRHREPLVLSVRVSTAADVQRGRAADELLLLDAQLADSAVTRQEYTERRDSILKDMDAGGSLQLGRMGDTWASEVALEVSPVDTEQWTALRWPAHVLLPAPDSGVLVVSADTAPAADFGVDPEDLANVAPGAYRLRAVIRGRLPAGRDTAMQSENATLTLVTARYDTSSAEARHALLVYLGRRGRFVEVERLARELLAANPEDLVALGVLGDACEAGGRYQEALDAYQKLLGVVLRSNPDEPPVLILQKIRRLRQEIH